MIDRENVLVALRKWFPDATADEIAAAANAIMGLPDEWEEVRAEEMHQGVRFRIFKKRNLGAR